MFSPAVYHDDSVPLAAAGSEVDTNNDATRVDLPLVLASPTQDFRGIDPPGIVFSPTVYSDDPVSLAAAGSEEDTNEVATQLVNDPPLPVLAVPTQGHLSPRSKLFQCCIYAEKKKFVLCYEQPSGDTSPPVLLATHKKLTTPGFPKYYIFNVSQVFKNGLQIRLTKNASQYLGKVRRRMSGHPNDYFCWAVHSKHSKSEANDVLAMDIALSADKKTSLLKAELDLYPEGSSASDRVLKFSNKTSSRKNKNGDDVYTLNFFDRCTGGNTANVQIVDGQGRVVLQLAQNGDNGKTFSLDFSAPFTPFTAFGFATGVLHDC
jgi:hypothetical protein